MSGKIPFAGKLVRMEPGGFEIVEFDFPVGPAANSHGIISTSTGTSVPTLTTLKPGLRISGIAEADNDHQLAAIETFTIVHDPS